MIDHKHKAIFVHIQKTGGSSISAALGHDPAHPQKHYTALELRALCDAQTWQNHYKFSFVRNPWSRLVSWWSMIDGHRPAFAAGARLNGFQQSVLQRAGNFQEFLENLDEDIVDTDGRKWIFRNQIDYLTDENGAMLVDFVGRTERMGQDFNLVATRLFGHPVDIGRHNVSSHAPYTTLLHANAR